MAMRRTLVPVGNWSPSIQEQELPPNKPQPLPSKFFTNSLTIYGNISPHLMLYNIFILNSVIK
jgi:hypothetical protein